MSRVRFHVVQVAAGGRRGRGGVASLVNYLADALPTNLPGVTVEVVDTYGPGPFWAMPPSFLAAVVKVLILRLSGRADVLHFHMAAHGSAIRKCALSVFGTAMGMPTIIHIHGSVFDDYYRELGPYRQSVLKNVLKRCARVVVIGTYWHDFVVRELGLSPDRVVLIHNGVPSAPPSASKGGDEHPELLMIGELGARKGTPELIAALASPELVRCRWTATLAGNGQVQEFRDLVASLGLSSRIRVPRWQTAHRVRDLLLRADILVLPSHDEGLPMAILEAMASGVAVIATPVGAIPDAVIDGETGLLVSPGDADALAGAILRLLNDTSLRQELASNARARWEAMFSIDRTASAVAAMYRELGIG